MQKLVKRPMTLGGQRKILANSLHPEHAHVKAEWENALEGMKDMLSEVAAAMKPYECEANEFLRLLDSNERCDLRTLPPMNCLSVLLLVSKIEDAEETIKKARSALARHASSRPRPRSGHIRPREKARAEWDKIKNEIRGDEERQKARIQLIKRIMKEYGISRRQTVSDWIVK